VGAALGLLAAATFARALLDPFLGHHAPFAFHFVAIILAAWIAGFEGGVVTTIGSVLAANFFFLEPRYTLTTDLEGATASLALFTVLGIFVSWQTSRWRKLERLAREQQQLFRSTLDNFPSVIAFKDRAGHFIDVNKAVERALRLPKSEIVGRPARNFVPATTADVVARHDREVARTGIPSQFEETVAMPDGNINYLSTIFPLVDADGVVYGTGHIAQDITQLRQTQDALTANERRLASLMDAATESIWLLDRDYILAANATAAKRLGRSIDEIRNTPWKSLIDPYVVPLRAAAVDRVFATAQPVTFEDVRDGMLFEHTFYPSCDARGTVVAVAAFSRDVTAQRRYQHEFRDLSQRLAYHVNHSPLAVIEFGPDMRITQWTGSAERMFGWTAEEVVGKKASDFRWIYEDDRTRVEQVAAEIQTGSHSATVSANRNYRKNGTILFCEWYNSALLDESGGMHSLLSLVLDVSERIRLHEELVTQTQELIAANRLKDEFLATLSHELRTPINAVLGWAQILKSAKLAPERVKKGLDTITRNARLQAHLVEDLLDVNRIVTGNMRLDVQPVDVWSVVDETLESLRPAADAKRQRISCNVERGLTLTADPMRLQQVLWNLLSNAVKFTAPGGSIIIGARTEDEDVAIVVSDTGIGIPPEFLPHVFERFRQADGSTTREHGGLGLGLAIVRHIVELHGGMVEARSEGVGRGATFIVRLPLRAAIGRSLIAMPA